jgi:hypothetical protein
VRRENKKGKERRGKLGNSHLASIWRSNYFMVRNSILVLVSLMENQHQFCVIIRIVNQDS